MKERATTVMADGSQLLQSTDAFPDNHTGRRTVYLNTKTYT